jgi:probable O-glycosylation ligase (exosortase A-associated)
MRNILLIFTVLTCSLVAIRRPVVGMLTFVWLGFFNPHSMTWTTFPLSQLVAGATILGYLLSPEPKRFPVQRESILLLVLWILFAITTAFAIYPDKAVVRLEFVSKVLLMVFLSMCLINTEERIHSLLRIIALSLGFYAVKGTFFAVTTGGSELVYGPEESFLYPNNLIGLALAMNLPLVGYLIKIERRVWLRWVLWVIFFSSFPAIIFTYSRGAWLGIALAAALMVLRSRYKFSIIAASVIVGIGLSSFLVDLTPRRLSQRYEALENYDTESSAQMRFGSWAYCRRVAYSNPITGGGFDHNSVENYQKYAPEYHERWGLYSSACHSSWFSMLGEHGFPAFILWLGLIGSVFVSLSRIRSVTVANPDLFWMFELAGAFQVSLAAYAVIGTFIDAAYFDMFYYLVAIVVILKEVMQRVIVEAASPVIAGKIGRVGPVILKGPVPS